MRNFIYEGPEWPELPTHNISGMRFYEVPDGDKYPSITSVLGAQPGKKVGLQKWRDRIGAVSYTHLTLPTKRIV